MFTDLPEWDDHEGVHFFTDPASGLRAVISVHSTHLGPASGGTRLWSYADEVSAVRDALRLSHAMSYKNAMAGLSLGGGKGVILRPEEEFDRKALFAAYGRAIEACGGTYKTAEDVGVGPADMDVIATQTSHVAGTTGEGAGGDPSPHTARGIYLAMKAAADRVFGSADLSGRTIAVQGLGSVGYGLARHLHSERARLVVADINGEAVAKAQAEFDAEAVDPATIHDADANIFAPCALSHAIRPDTVDSIRAKLICGGANNQLASTEMGERLRARGVLYAPDYIVNAGGIINVASELSGSYDPVWVARKVDAIPDTLRAVLDHAESANIPPAQAADTLARERIGRG